MAKYKYLKWPKILIKEEFKNKVIKLVMYLHCFQNFGWFRILNF